VLALHTGKTRLVSDLDPQDFADGVRIQTQIAQRADQLYQVAVAEQPITAELSASRNVSKGGICT